MRKVPKWLIVLGVCALFVLQTYLLFRGHIHMDGVGTASSFIQQFNAGGAPRGIALDDTYDETLVAEKKPYIEREVRVVGSDALKVYLYLNPADESVVFVRLDETLATADTDSVLPDMNAYLYATFFTDANEDELLQSIADIKGLCMYNHAVTLIMQQGYLACFTRQPDAENASIVRSAVYAMTGSSSSHFDLAGYLYE